MSGPRWSPITSPSSPASSQSDFYARANQLRTTGSSRIEARLHFPPPYRDLYTPTCQINRTAPQKPAASYQCSPIQPRKTNVYGRELAVPAGSRDALFSRCDRPLEPSTFGLGRQIGYILPVKPASARLPWPQGLCNSLRREPTEGLVTLAFSPAPHHVGSATPVAGPLSPRLRST